MKKLFRCSVLFSLSFIIVLHIVGQESAPEFCPPGATWHYNSTDAFHEPQHQVPGHHPYFKVHYDRDTLLDNKIAKVLIETLVTLDTTWIYNEIILYQDNWRIYSWEHSDFRLLYDYTLKEGDKYVIYFEPRFFADFKDTVMIELVVDSVKMVIIEGEEMRAYHTQQIENEFFAYQVFGWNYFKIGNLNAFRPINQILCDAYYCPYEGIRCYSDSNFFWQTSDLPCDALLASSVRSIGKGSIEMYPNPTTDILNIRTEDVLSGVTVFGPGGKKVTKLEVYNNQVQLADLTPGLYFLQINVQGQFLWRRVVKI